MKRFKVTGSGKVRRHKAYKSHILTKKSQKRKRNLRKGTILTERRRKENRVCTERVKSGEEVV